MTEPMPEYHKISGPFRRETEGPNRNKVIPGAWTMPELGYLADLPWLFTEKVDGTNIRVHWDGHKPVFGGRTGNAQIPAKLVGALNNLFPEELFEQAFGATPVTLYGEGYGAGIQKGGGNYRQDQSFVLFDVLIDGWWLARENVEGIATKLGIDVVPVVATCTLNEAIAAMSKGDVFSEWGPFLAEGMVGTPTVPLFTRGGHRIIVKVKHADFAGSAAHR